MRGRAHRPKRTARENLSGHASIRGRANGPLGWVSVTGRLLPQGIGFLKHHGSGHHLLIGAAAGLAVGLLLTPDHPAVWGLHVLLATLGAIVWDIPWVQTRWRKASRWLVARLGGGTETLGTIMLTLGAMIVVLALPSWLSRLELNLPLSATSPFYRGLAQTTMRLGQMMLLGALMYSALFGRRDRQPPFIIPLNGAIILGLGGTAIRHIGPALEAATQAEPVRVAVSSALLAALALLFKNPLTKLVPRITEPVQEAPASTGRPLAPTQKDRRRTAWHEAGHALVLAALRGPGRRTSLSVRVHKKGGGHVVAYQGFDQARSADFLEWSLLMRRAGYVAESCSPSLEPAPRSLNDFQEWEAIARDYLQGGHRGYFYTAPQSEQEEAANRRALEGLLQEHTEALEGFFVHNYAVLEELAEALNHEGHLDQEALEPFLDRVEVPDSFPRVLVKPQRTPV